jgi:hypothetical protein
LVISPESQRFLGWKGRFSIDYYVLTMKRRFNT